MANKYDEWVGTGPVQLPIDEYQTSAILNEQKTQQALQDIQNTISTFENIKPFGADATALYEQTMGKLRQNVAGVAKMGLDTPEAKRKIKQILGDRDIINPLKNIMTDSLLAAQRKKELDEYLKKNPSVNAYDYNYVFNRVGQETGDAAKFNPSRFSNLPALVDYTDVNKIVEDGIGKLKADEQEQKRIFGDKYVTLKQSGLLEGKIRQHVMSQMRNNPLVNEQLRRNINHSIYQADPYQRDAGITKLASSYRQNYTQVADEIIKDRESKLAGKSIKEIEANPKLKGYRLEIEKARNMLKGYDDKSDEDIINATYADSFLGGFDQFAYRKNSKEEEFNPMAVARFNMANRWAMHNQKMALIKEAMEPGPPLSNPLPLSQTDIDTPGSLKKIINNIPQLSDIGTLMDDKGFVKKTIDGGSVARNPNFIQFQANNSMYYNFINKNDSKILQPGEKAPEGWTKVGTLTEGGKLKPVYAKPGAKPVNDMKKLPGGGTQMTGGGETYYNNAVTKLKTYLTSIGADPAKYNDLKTEVDVRGALQDVARFNHSSDQAYLNTYTIQQSNTDYMRQLAANSIGTAGLLDQSGNIITDEKTKQDMMKHLLASNAMINVTPALMDKKRNESYFTFTGSDGKVYHAAMPAEWNNLLSSSRIAIKQGLNNKTGVVTNYDGSINIIEMTKGGGSYGVNIPMGATPQYQERAKQYWDDNVKRVMKLGYTEKDATDLLNSNYETSKGTIMSTGKEATLRLGKGDVTIYVPIKNRAGKYYTEASLFDNQGKTRSIGDYIRGNLVQFSSPKDNPYIQNATMNQLSQKTREAMIMGQASDDFDFSDDMFQ